MTRCMLAFLALATIWVFCKPLSAQPREPAQPKVIGMPREAIGAGETVEKAKANALKKALDDVELLMQGHQLSHFKVDQAYVQKHVVEKEGRSVEDLEFPGQAPLKQWVFNFRTDNGWWSEIERQDRAEARQEVSSRVMIGLSILLFAGYGYVRIDEYTNRRYTKLLRAVGVGAIAAAVAGWYMIVG